MFISVTEEFLLRKGRFVSKALFCGAVDIWCYIKANWRKKKKENLTHSKREVRLWHSPFCFVSSSCTARNSPRSQHGHRSWAHCLRQYGQAGIAPTLRQRPRCHPHDLRFGRRTFQDKGQERKVGIYIHVYRATAAYVCFCFCDFCILFSSYCSVPMSVSVLPLLSRWPLSSFSVRCPCYSNDELMRRFSHRAP